MKCGEGVSILLATTNSATPILRTMGVCVNRKSGLCIPAFTSVLFISVKPALLPCWFSLPKLASGVDNIQFGYVRKYELTVVVKSSRNSEKEARARRERLEYQRGTEEGALRVFDDIDRHVAILQLQSSFTEKPSRTAHTIPDSVHGVFQRADGLVLEAMYLTAKTLQQLRRIIELTIVCCVRIPKLFAVSWLYSGEEEASPSLSVKIEGAYIPINHWEEAWKESGCIMWDFATNQYPQKPLLKSQSGTGRARDGLDGALTTEDSGKSTGLTADPVGAPTAPLTFTTKLYQSMAKEEKLPKVRVDSIEDELMEFAHGKIVLALEGG
ncbi:hypothetical protein Nepgr_026558 [Nepenthes gracilis]|uniref:Uncharacterized protein n=1 Tax=Nepenthes gracilis TaxID=150966 RepID=A0AAD3T817_NEPGR|nr:hypothetical protein Nepgr_026558 [Nepenthes gracilis]